MDVGSQRGILCSGCSNICGAGDNTWFIVRTNSGYFDLPHWTRDSIRLEKKNSSRWHSAGLTISAMLQCYMGQVVTCAIAVAYTTIPSAIPLSIELPE